MNNIQQTFSTLSFISSTGGRRDKDSALMRLRDISQAKAIVALATDQFSNYWVTVDEAALPPAQGVQEPEAMQIRFHDFQQLCRELRDRGVTGDAARERVRVFLRSCSAGAPYQEQLWYARTLNRHLNIGVAGASISSVWPDLVSDFGVPLAESLYEQHTGKRVDSVYNTITFPLTIEPKLDGLNGSLVSSGERNGVFSRAEGTWPALARWSTALQKALRMLSQAAGKSVGDWVINGEFKATLQSDDPKNWKSSWGKSTAMCRAGLSPDGFDQEAISKHLRLCFERGDLVFTAYDVYPYATYKTGTFSELYGHYSIKGSRSARLRSLVAAMKKVDPSLPVVHVQQRLVSSWDEARVFHTEHLVDGHEGSMLKPMRPCTLDRTSDIVKWKEYDLRDAVILAVTEGTGKNRGVRAGAFWCWFPDIDSVNKVTVRGNALKDWAWKNQDVVAGIKMEASEQIDGAHFRAGVRITDKAEIARVADIRNPVLSRLRVDVPPLAFEQVQALCARFKLPTPVRQLTPAEYNRVLAGVPTC